MYYRNLSGILEQANFTLVRLFDKKATAYKQNSMIPDYNCGYYVVFKTRDFADSHGLRLQ